MNELKIILLLNIFFFIFCSDNNLKEKNENIIELEINNFYNGDNIVGKRGTIILEAEIPWDLREINIIDTSKTPCFESTISNSEKESLNISCGLWRESINSDMLIFCNVNETIPQGQWYLSLKKKSFNYNKYLINLVADKDFSFVKKNEEKIDIYSSKQILNLDDGNESYNIKFKIISYNDEILVINWKKILDNCKIVKNELICTITKSEIITLIDPDERLYLRITYVDNNYNTKSFALVPYIDIVYNTIKKQDVYVLITKLIENVTEHDSLFAYETNVTDIDNIYMDIEQFELPFENNGEGEETSCSFRKYENNPLLLVCFTCNEPQCWMKEIKSDIILNNINIKYNFIIKPAKIEDKIYRDRSYGSFIFWVYPEVMDFTKKDLYIIEYCSENVDSIKGITFNENEKDLDCKVESKHIKRCVVLKSHFKGKKTGYYFTKHQNHLNTKSVSYEASPIKVILP